jgi:hypothetical protein
MKFLSPLFFALSLTASAATLERLQYNHPGLTVDLGVGLWAWPLPMDFDGDGDLDLVVSCPDKPYNGTYFFENPGTNGQGKMPVFKPGKRISKGMHNVRLSYVDGKPRVLTPGAEYPDFLNTGLEKPTKIFNQANVHPNGVRANEWHYADYDGDGIQDLLVAVEDWTHYVWDNAYDENGHWTNGMLNGFIYHLKNTGTNEAPVYDKAKLLTSANTTLNGFGMPSPTYTDFDGDGDFDLICGEFLDGFTYYQNTGTRQKPKFSLGKRLKSNGKYVRMDLEMITPVGIDWDKDGDTDLICGDEDGRVAFIENTGVLDDRKVPAFLPPVYFQQEAQDIKCGALATPVGIDWDGDGDDDIISGNTAGYIVFYENLSGPKVAEPKWAAPRQLQADGKIIRIMAGANGSIQGPAEAKWGYTTINVNDWDNDGLPDIIANSILGKVHWYKNIGARKSPKLAAAQSIEVEWKDGVQPTLAWGWLRPEGKALLTQWRTTPVLVDWNKDGLTDLAMLDHEGYLSFFERQKQGGKLILLPPQRVFCNEQGEPLQFNKGIAGKSGRRKLTITDWDGDGAMDILINSANSEQWKQIGQKDGKWLFKNIGNVSDRNIEGHDTSPTMVDFDGNGIKDLVIGAEDGRFYFLKNPRAP